MWGKRTCTSPAVLAVSGKTKDGSFQFQFMPTWKLEKPYKAETPLSVYAGGTTEMEGFVYYLFGNKIAMAPSQAPFFFIFCQPKTNMSPVTQVGN